MRAEFVDRVNKIYGSVYPADKALEQIMDAIHGESVRGYEAGDVDCLGSVIIGFVPDFEGYDLSIEQKVEVATAFNDNESCLEFLVDSTRELMYDK